MSRPAASTAPTEADVRALETDPAARPPEVLGAERLRDVTEDVTRLTERATPRWWYLAFALAATVAGAGLVAIVYLAVTGVGVWGLNQPVGWAFDITNFVFWIGIGHAGTLISAILHLMRQRWRTSINRAAEAMTLFAVACAGIFPLIHVGRLWRIYFVAPVPNHLAIWPNFRSPLLWDVFAVTAYGLVSLMFFYVGLLPDLATMRDRARTRLRATVFGVLAMGWRGGGRQWRHYEMCYLLLAGLSTPLVLSVHTIVSFDFAVSVLPGWHTTIFPPYFVVGAIFGGFAMVLLLLVPARRLFALQDLITVRHLDVMAKILLFCSCVIGYAYGTELFIAWYSGNPLESFVFFESRLGGPYAWAFAIMVGCNVLAPQVLWSQRMRRSPLALLVVGALVTIGMWFERFVIIVTSLFRDALPSSWGFYWPTWVELLTLAGTFGIFLSLYLLFIRFLPMVAISEVKGVMDADRQRGATPEEDEGALPPPPDGPVALAAEVAGPEALVDAARRMREAGYRRLETYSPFAVHGVDRALGARRSGLGWWTLGGAVVGGGGGLLLQWWTSAVDYPLVTGGKPYASWPAFVPILFELAILCAAIATVAGMFRLGRMPRLHHPLHGLDRFDRASDDRFFLVVDADDEVFDAEATPRHLRESGGRQLAWVEA